jgi:uncharacterized Zn finger protein (UPF0148 family)
MEAKFREFERQKKQAKEEATKNNTTMKRITAPKVRPPYQHCHCSQLFCTSIGLDTGSSCPIKCKAPDGTLYGKDSLGNCACPICVCQCSLAYTHDAAQIVCVKKMLDENAIQQKKEIDSQKRSQSTLASIIQEVGSSTIASALAANGKNRYSMDELKTMALSALACSITTNFSSTDHSSFLPCHSQ